MIKQVFHNYNLWECYKNGMWRKVDKQQEEMFLKQAISFTGNHILYGEAMLKVIRAWEYTCIHNLTDTSNNKRAFIGHAACCYEFNCPEYITRQAWGYLTEEQRFLANKKADLAFNEWLKNYKISIRKTNNYLFQGKLFEYEG